MLSSMLKKTLEDIRINHYFHPRECPLVSHLLNANDILLFVNSVRRTLKKILKTLATYEAWSGQAINKEKSIIFMSNHINSFRRRELLRTTRFSEGRFPVTYLRALFARVY